MSEQIQLSGDKISDWMENPVAKKRLKNALAGWLQPEEFLAAVEIAYQDPKIKQCGAASKFEVLFKMASLQLLPSFGQVALIPKGRNLDLMPQWAGYKALMERHPDVERIDAQYVMEGEDYKLDASTGQFIHEFDPFVGRDLEASLKGLKGGYLRIIYSNPAMDDKYHFVTKDTIVKAKGCSRGNVWSKWPMQMVMKTLYKDGFGRRAVPVDPLYNKGLDELDKIDNESMENDPSRVAVSGEPKSLSSMTEDLKPTESREPGFITVENSELGELPSAGAQS